MGMLYVNVSKERETFQILLKYPTFHFIDPHQNIITCISDYRQDLDWWIDLLTTYGLTTNNYNSVAPH
jgi:hypothetical protein